MSIAKGKPTLTPEAYLEWEKTSETKHEYLDGDIFAMAGAKDSHVTVSGNLFALLKNHLRGGPCRTYISDMKIQAEQASAFFYPDVMVTCDERDRQTEYFKRYPTLIAEVLSEATAAFDRGRKFAAYRTLENLREYVIIDPDSLSVECFRRDTEGHWVLYPFGPGETVELASVDFSSPIEIIYEGVEMDATQNSHSQ